MTQTAALLTAVGLALCGRTHALCACPALARCPVPRAHMSSSPVVDKPTPAAGRREVLGAVAAGVLGVPLAARAEVTSTMPMPALSSAQQGTYGKQRIVYPDFTMLPSGVQVKDAKKGAGEGAGKGDRVVIDWTGYTIGYYGRPFEAKNGAKGGDFEGEKDFYRFTMGKGTVIPALEEALLGAKVGQIRQVIVPPEFGYPLDYDRAHDAVGPKPTSFSGQRALDFVLQNKGLIDKTLLFNVEVKRIDRPGERGFKG